MHKNKTKKTDNEIKENRNTVQYIAYTRRISKISKIPNHFGIKNRIDHIIYRHISQIGIS